MVGAELAHMNGLVVCKHTVKADGIYGIFRGFGTLVVGTIAGRIIFLTSLEVLDSNIKRLQFEVTQGTGINNVCHIKACRLRGKYLSIKPIINILSFP